MKTSTIVIGVVATAAVVGGVVWYMRRRSTTVAGPMESPYVGGVPPKPVNLALVAPARAAGAAPSKRVSAKKKVGSWLTRVGSRVVKTAGVAALNQATGGLGGQFVQ